MFATFFNLFLVFLVRPHWRRSIFLRFGKRVLCRQNLSPSCCNSEKSFNFSFSWHFYLSLSSRHFCNPSKDSSMQRRIIKCELNLEFLFNTDDDSRSMRGEEGDWENNAFMFFLCSFQFSFQLRLHDQHENKVHPRCRFTQLGAEGEWDSCNFQKYSPGIRRLCLKSIHHSKSADFFQVCTSNLFFFAVLTELICCSFYFFPHIPRSFDRNIRNRIECYGSGVAK